ncbi:MAG: TatD family hydrolase [Colwellia sp.]|nr:TatD family hydrolase [Colwellia sp.]
MKFTDSHCHLDFDEFNSFDQQSNQLIAQCYKANIHQIIVPSIHPDNWQKVLTLATKYSQRRYSKNEHANNKVTNPDECIAQPITSATIYACLGIHPWFLTNLNHTHLDDLARNVEKNSDNIVAIGETGIDGAIVKQQDNLNQQIDFFSYQLELAKRHHLPVIVHHRQSHQHIIPMLKKLQLAKSGIIHAFSGSYQQAKDYLDLGFKLGIGGTITYPRARKTINAIKRLPLSSLVLETDAPAMPLFGQQGKVNSPLALLTIFKSLVEIRDEEKEEIAQQIESNINQVFTLNQ